MNVSNEDNERDPATLIGVEQAAQVLRLSHWAVRYRVKHGLLRFIRRKRRLLFDPAELLRALEAQKSK